MEYCFFEKARPIFLKDKSTSLNTFAAFRTELDDIKNAKLHITAFGFYRLTVNGRFVSSSLFLHDRNVTKTTAKRKAPPYDLCLS